MLTSPEVDLVCSARLGRLCRLDDSLLDGLTSQLDTLQVEQEPSSKAGGGTPDVNFTASASAQSAASTDPSSAVPSAITSTDPPDGEEEDESDSSFEDECLVWRTGDAGFDHDSDGDRDFTACSADDCGYYGRCSY